MQQIAKTENAPAKINLTLRILGRRLDGLHELESLVAFADSGDRLSFEPGGNEFTLDATGPFAGALTGLVRAPAENIVLKAACLFAQSLAPQAAGRFRLDKNIPVAAGLGGGSSDAAAALRLLAQTYGVAPEDPRLWEIARKLGADVPVCLHARACVMTGTGETLEPLKNFPELSAVLVNPGVAVSTGDVFADLGLKPGEQTVKYLGDSGFLTAPDGRSFLNAVARSTNDLERAACGIEPEITLVKSAIANVSERAIVRMSGSGATCFGLFEDHPAAEDAATRLKAGNPNWWVQAVRLC